MTQQNTRRGIWLMVATAIIFAIQDAMSRHLAGTYNTWMVVMIRFWVLAAFATIMVMRMPGGIRGALATRHPGLQTARGVILVVEIMLAIVSFTIVGLVNSHAIFAFYPLLIVALSGPILGERIGWRRWTAVAVGLVGVLVILQPGSGMFGPGAVLQVAATCMFAVYGLLTRKVGNSDPAMVSLFWVGIIGMVISTAVGIWHLEPMATSDMVMLGVLSCTAIAGHLAMIRAYEVAEASVIQPFAYLQLVFVTGLGVWLFGETLTMNVLIGGLIVVSASLFAMLRGRRLARAGRG